MSASGDTEGGAGSPPFHDRRLALGVDIGGTKIDVALVDGAGRVHVRDRVPTPRGGHEPILDAVADALGTVMGRLPNRAPAAIGVGAPGVVDADGRVTTASNVIMGWAGASVRDRLAGATGLRVVVDNDVRVAAYAEAALAPTARAANLIFVSLGTGVGGAIIRDGAIVRGARRTAGEIAHLLVPGAGAVPCGCGRFDHLEAVASGPAIAARYANSGGADCVSMADVAERARQGDELARRVIADAARCLGRVLAGLLTALDVDEVVIGGGVANVGALLMTPLRAALADEVPGYVDDVRVRAAALGDSGPVVGAALMALAQPATLDKPVGCRS